MKVVKVTTLLTITSFAESDINMNGKFEKKLERDFELTLVNKTQLSETFYWNIALYVNIEI